MNAAEGVASEAEAALRKARKHTDAAGSTPSAPVSGTNRRQPVAEVLIMSTKSVFIGSTLTLISRRWSYVETQLIVIMSRVKLIVGGMSIDIGD